MDATTTPESIDAVKTRRADLHAIMVDLEHAIAAAAPGREESWSHQVRGALGRLADSFAQHVSGTERPDGLFDQVRRRAPRLDNHCRRLVGDHQTIAVELTNATSALDRDVAEVRESVLSLLAHLARHRQLGADLVYEAYAVDLGGGD